MTYDGSFGGITVHCVPDDDEEAIAQGVPFDVVTALCDPGAILTDGRAFFIRAADWETLKAGMDRAGVLTRQ